MSKSLSNFNYFLVPGINGCKLRGEDLTEANDSTVVADLICNGIWNLNTLHGRITREEEDLILKIPIPVADKVDCVVW